MLKSHINPGERVKADEGYIKEPLEFINPQETLFIQQHIQNRLETANKRMKNWVILKQVYRRQFDCNDEEFCAIAVVTQLSIKGGEPLLSCWHCVILYHINEDEMEEVSSGSEFLSDRTDEEDKDNDL